MSDYINVCGMWKNTSKKGEEYYSGPCMGEMIYQIWSNKNRPNEKSPPYRLVIKRKPYGAPEEQKEQQKETDDNLPF